MQETSVTLRLTCCASNCSTFISDFIGTSPSHDNMGDSLMVYAAVMLAFERDIKLLTLT